MVTNPDTPSLQHLTNHYHPDHLNCVDELSVSLYKIFSCSLYDASMTVSKSFRLQRPLLPMAFAT